MTTTVSRPIPIETPRARKTEGGPVVAVGIAAATATAVVVAATNLGVLETATVAAALWTTGWWVTSRDRLPRLLDAVSLATVVLAGAAYLAGGGAWQLVPWQTLVVLTAGAAIWRTVRPGRRRRWARALSGAGLSAIAVVGAGALLVAPVPVLPEPTGPFAVGTQTFVWTDTARDETLTEDPTDVRQVVAQAWYPSDAATGSPADYVGADGPVSLFSGFPAWFWGRYDRIDTHAYSLAPVSDTRSRWPVLIFSPGWSVARQSNTALMVDLASRGYVVLALSHTYDSPATVLGDDRVVDAAAELMDEIPAQVKIRAADARFALDQFEGLARTDPGSPLARRLDLDGVGIFGHSLGGATAVAVVATDDRFAAGVNMDGRLFGQVPRLDRPFLWVQSDGSANGGPGLDATYRTRDALLGKLQASGALVTVEESAHLSFTDVPAYVTPPGRRVIGLLPGSPIGPLSVESMNPLVADVLTGFMGPVLGGPSRGDLNQVTQRHPTVHVEHVLATRR
jgi:predicted dienelactone hydrolase